MPRKRSIVPTKPDDARVQRSIEALVAAFLDLLDDRPLGQISIKEITEKAGLSYPTFFRRFASKEELLEHTAATEIQNLMQSGQVAKGTELGDAARAMCEYIAPRRKLWTALLNGGGAAAMREEFKRVARDIGERRPMINPWLPMDLSIAVVTSGFFEIFAWWMRQRPDYPVENVITLLNELIVKDSMRARDVTMLD